MKFCLFIIFILVFGQLVYENRKSSQSLKKDPNSSKGGINPETLSKKPMAFRRAGPMSTNSNKYSQPLNSKPYQVKNI
jgi:hypothetical protein